MTPIGGTTLGYCIVALASLLALYTTAAMIWDASAGIRCVYAREEHSYSKYETGIRCSLVIMFLIMAIQAATVAYLARIIVQPH
jgi:hypothetical protein